MFKRIALITNSTAANVKETLNSVIRFLLSLNIELELEQNCSLITEYKSLPVVKDAELGANSDLVIAIGGDGTMLKATHLACRHNIPLLGINRGRLGFLADIPADNFQQHIEDILAGNFAEDERFLLHSEAYHNGKKLRQMDALNDVILHKWNTERLVEFETYVDDTFVHRQRSDGIIVSTPTGSTAYALSGGGPILYPSLNALVLVPICPHSLTNRPLVINANSVVEIVVGNRDIDHARLTCDSEIVLELEPGDRVMIKKKNQTIRLIHPAGHDHFSILRAKLNWG